MIKILDIEKMRKASQLAAHVLDEVEKIIKPGVTTLEINDLCHKIIVENKGRPAALNYHGFPKSVCTSINNVICHGIPSATDILANGDFINVDVALELDTHYGDTSRCFKVGKLLDKHRDLMMVTYEAMWKAIGICKGGLLVNEIGKIMESFIKPHKYSIVRDFCGHGIGNEMHMDIDVPYYYDKNNKDILVTGKCYTIEPMINGGSCKMKIDEKDKWTARTVDGSRSAQWEHTIYINDDGCEVMSFNSFDEKNKKSRVIYC